MVYFIFMTPILFEARGYYAFFAVPLMRKTVVRKRYVLEFQHGYCSVMCSEGVGNDGQNLSCSVLGCTVHYRTHFRFCSALLRKIVYLTNISRRPWRLNWIRVSSILKCHSRLEKICSYSQIIITWYLPYAVNVFTSSTVVNAML